MISYRMVDQMDRLRQHTIADVDCTLPNDLQRNAIYFRPDFLPHCSSFDIIHFSEIVSNGPRPHLYFYNEKGHYTVIRFSLTAE